MKMQFNTTLLTKQAFDLLSKDFELEKVEMKAWLLGVTLDDGKTIAMYPISSINPTAPPYFYMTGSECGEQDGLHNRTRLDFVVRKFRKYSKSKQLRSAAKQLQYCITLMSKG